METKLVVMLALFCGTLAAQMSPAGAWTAGTAHDYMIRENITYSTANGHDNKLDLYVHRNPTGTHPVMIYIHGGGWLGGTKEMSMFGFLPYIEWGWDVVNVEYRMGGASLAPAAVEDCRCALRWVFDHAAEYKFDTSRVVVTGGSAGGHLALTTGMLTSEADFDRTCF
ncbi:MAG: alpha/beta hydrolase, partial [Acidobacteria bacterium]|nr:alpha/beta hydrolase [Acidobacteriota bacterium]